MAAFWLSCCRPTPPGPGIRPSPPAPPTSVTLLFYGAIAIMFMRPRAKRSVKLDKVVSIFYTAVTPMLNPFVYSLRNKEVRAALSRVRRKALLMCHRHWGSF